jgi:hypothetical protein
MQPDTDETKRIDWPSRRLWMTVGHIGTAAWIVFVLARTGGNVDAPMFELIFVVPLAAWIAGLLVARIVGALSKRGRG